MTFTHNFALNCAAFLKPSQCVDRKARICILLEIPVLTKSFSMHTVCQLETSLSLFKLFKEITNG